MSLQMPESPTSTSDTSGSSNMDDANRHVIQLADGVDIAFRKIPACPEGFLIGSRDGRPSEQPLHRVLFPDPFWLAETPVTVEQFGTWNVAKARPGFSKIDETGTTAVGTINWEKAVGYCDWLEVNFKECLPAQFTHIRLPLESEWEYACRGGQPYPGADYHTGDGLDALDDCGWYGEGNRGRPHPVAQRAPNLFGLYDMHGNVREWCQDRGDDKAYLRRWDGIQSEETFALSEMHGDQASRIVRGGSSLSVAIRCRAACRIRNGHASHGKLRGFRPCIALTALPDV